ncbi:MAG: hypothetical protein ACTHMY_01590 [Solirubrobacteraceae bacterium]
MTSRSRAGGSLRDRESERHWLDAAELDIGRSGFAEHALSRLAAGEEAYGDRWSVIGLDQLLGELREEAADLGSWGVLCLQAVELEELEGAGGAGESIATRVRAAILFGAYAYVALGLAQDELSAVRRRGGRDA